MELPNISYTTGTATVTNAANTVDYAIPGTLQGGIESPYRAAQQLFGVNDSWRIYDSHAQTFDTLTKAVAINQTDKKEKQIVARLIRYTVVDPDPQLADQRPEISIILSGSAVLNGTDDKGFLMELAPKIAKELEGHNTIVSTLTWEDKEGKTRTFKARRLSNLDVVIEVLKTW